MTRLIRIIKTKFRLSFFLLWHDKSQRGLSKAVAIAILTLIGGLWSFPLENLTSIGVMPPERQQIIRVTGTCLLLVIAVLIFVIIGFLRYRKYKHTESLNAEELNDFLSYMNNKK